MGDVVSYLVEKGFKLGAYVTDAFWYDVGSLERYERLDNEALAEAMGFLF
jgi:mannose-1-phosphate guanylyltransferase